MQIIREFLHNLTEVSHMKIGIQLPKLWNLEVQFWVPIFAGHWIYGKMEHENGFKIWPPPKRVI